MMKLSFRILNLLVAVALAASALDVFAHATAHYGKPAFGIDSVTIDGAPHAVTMLMKLWMT